MAKPRTNEAFVRQLMNFSESGALMQAFVMTALEKYADQCKDQEPAAFDSSWLNGAAWVATAKELRQRLDDFYASTTTPRDLTGDEMAELQVMRRAFGRTWKEELRKRWEAADAGPTLQALRNTHGPQWLARFKLPEAV